MTAALRAGREPATLLRVRLLCCSANREADATPEIVRIGYQPRRDPCEVAHPPVSGRTSACDQKNL